MHQVVAELDARGEIDGHAAMCLRQAIRETCAGAIELVLVDLRDLTAIGPDGLELLRDQKTDCQAHGVALGVLISGGERQARLAAAFVLEGLGDALHYAADAAVPSPPGRNRRRLRARGRHAGQFARAGARSWSRRPRASRPT